MTLFYVAQLFIPLAVLLGILLVPPSGRVALCLLVAGAALWLAAIWLAGIWLVLPRWLVPLYLIALASAAWRAWHHRPDPPVKHTWRNRGGALLGISLGALAVFTLSQAIGGRTQPDSPTVALASPLGGGRYVVANGGYSAVTNGGHHMTLDQRVPQFRRFFGQSMAVDIAKLNFWGRTTGGFRPSDPAAYAIFSDPVMAPCSGPIVAARGDRPDMQVPEMDRTVMLGNHVILQCGDYHIVLAHLRKGSVLVTAGDAVTTGEKLGEVGNSGNTGEPHLHIHAQLPGTTETPISGAPVPITIDGRYPVRNDRL